MRSSAENISKPEPRLPESRGESSPSTEFAARWLKRKQEERKLPDSSSKELEPEKGRDALPATRLSRLLHKIDIKPEKQRNINLQGIGLEFSRTENSSELHINHSGEYPQGELYIKNETQHGQQETPDSTDGIEEAIFDQRHEQLDHAMPQAKSFELKQDPGNIAAASSQTAIPLADILADKPYAQTNQAKVPIAAQPVLGSVWKSYKTFVLYGFLAGVFVVVIMAIFMLR